MSSHWRGFVLGVALVLAVGLLLVFEVEGNEGKVVGARCSLGRTGAWGYWREVQSKCVGTKETQSIRCKEGGTTLEPRLVCVRQSGHSRVRRMPSRTTTTRRIEQIFKCGFHSMVTRPMTMISPTTTTRPTTSTTRSTMAMPMVFSAEQAQEVAKKNCAAKYRAYLRKWKKIKPFIPKKTQLIAGGIPAEPEEFPHMAALGYHPPGSADDLIVWRCGGSLISPLFVLTAAHCIYDSSTGKVLWALLGSIDTADPLAQRIDVIETIRHPAYTYSSHYNDIALLKLEHAPKMGPGLRPACVGIQSHAEDVVAPDEFGTAYEVTGWGINVTNGHESEFLMTVDLYQVPVKRCDEAFDFLTVVGKKLVDGVNRDSMLCIGSKESGKDSCQGDSGGPAQTHLYGTDKFGMYDIAGITSFGESTCGGNVTKVSIYTNVRYFLPWIVAIVWPD